MLYGYLVCLPDDLELVKNVLFQVLNKYREKNPFYVILHIDRHCGDYCDSNYIVYPSIWP